MATRMQQRRGTSTQWETANPVLNAGEIGWESNTNQFKIGDGTNHWNDLPYFIDQTTLTTQLGDYVDVDLLGVANGVATLNSSGVLESSQLPDISEITSDTMNGVLVAGNGVTKSYDDNGNTITLSVDTSVIATKAELAEVAQDSVNDALVAGDGISKSYNDSANTVTLSIDNTVATLSDTQTLTNKTISLANNTLLGTLDQFNAAMTDGNFTSTDELNYAVSQHSDSTFGVHGVSGDIVGTSDTQTLSGKTINLANNTISGTLAEFNTAISDDNILPTSGGTLSGFLTLHAEPTDALHAATKSYVDAVSQGLHIHESARVATTANVNLSTGLEPGDVVDGVTLAQGDRILVKEQTNAAQNGIYVVQASGAAVRATDFDEPAEVDGGDFIFVNSGTLYGDTGWVQVTDSVTVIGTDPIEFTQFSGAGTYIAGPGLTLTGNEFAIGNSVVTLDEEQTLSNKSISLGTNTVSGNISQFNAALSDADFATLNGAETLTNKVISVTGNNSITVTSTNVSDFTLASQNVINDKVLAGDGIDRTFDVLANTFVFSIDSNVVTLADTQTLTNKTIDLSNNTLSASLSELNSALSDADLATLTGNETLTNKTIDLSNNNISGTIGQFNSALSDADFATLDGTETLKNKTINLANNTVSGTIAQFNSALSDANFVTLQGNETLSNKTISLSNNTVEATIAQLNAAVTDANIATIAGTEEIFNKTINLANNTITGTISQFNAALAGTDFATLDGTETFLNKTINAANNTITVTSANVTDFVEASVDAAANALTSGTHTNITVTYNDAAGTINIEAAPGYSDEQAQDAVGNALGSGLQYNDSTGAISVNTSVIQARVANVSDTEIGYLDGVTSAIQTQLNSKASTTDLSNHESDTTNIHGIADTTKIVYTTDTGTVTSTMIANGTIVDGDISGTAAIALSKLATDPLARANHTGTQLASTISDFDTQVRTSRLDQMAVPNVALNMNSRRITSLADPTGAQDAATKAYVDAATSGLNVHASVKAATTANINLSTDVENGDTLDGVTLATGNRILVKNQTTKSQNGVYVVSASGAPTRAADYNEVAEVDAGDFIFVESGTTNGKTGWIQVNSITTLGTDDIEFTQFSGAGTYLAGTGLTLTGSIFSINTATTVDLNTAQTLTNKTLTSPTLTSPALGTPASGVMTNVTGLPLTTGVTGTLPVANGGTGVTSSTGTGSVVLSNSPTLVTPALGTPSSATLTNATGLPLTTGVTGTLPVANGGTGITSLGSGVATFLGTPSSANLFSALTDDTGTGLVVFNNSPLLVTPRVQMSINSQTGTSYTPVLTDASNRLVTLDNTGAITLTLPPSVFSVGDSVIFQQTNTGQVTFAQGSGVTITSAGATISAPKIRTRYSSATMICTGTNTFTVIGDIV